MKEQIQKLLELGFPLKFEYKVHPSNGYADNPADVPDPIKKYTEPTYWEVKEWLWSQHSIYFKLEYSISIKAFLCKPIVWKEGKINSIESNRPMTAEREAIKSAIECLYEQIKKKQII